MIVIYFDTSVGGAMQFVYVYCYSCEPVLIHGFFGNEEEISVKVKACSMMKVPVFDVVNGDVVGNFEVKKNCKFEWEESIVVITVLCPLIAGVDMKFRASGFDTVIGEFGEEVEVMVFKGCAFDLYYYDGEGICYFGFGQ